MIKYNPKIGPAQLSVESNGRPSMASVDGSFYNQDRLGYHSRLAKNEKIRPVGIRGSIGAMSQLREPSMIWSTHLGLLIFT
jgi:hypothetical protein